MRVSLSLLAVLYSSVFLHAADPATATAWAWATPKAQSCPGGCTPGQTCTDGTCPATGGPGCESCAAPAQAKPSTAAMWKYTDGGRDDATGQYPPPRTLGPFLVTDAKIVNPGTRTGTSKLRVDFSDGYDDFTILFDHAGVTLDGNTDKDRPDRDFNAVHAWVKAHRGEFGNEGPWVKWTSWGTGGYGRIEVEMTSGKTVPRSATVTPDAYAAALARVERGERVTLVVGAGGVSMPGKPDGVYDCWLTADGPVMQRRTAKSFQVPPSSPQVTGFSPLTVPGNCPGGRCPAPTTYRH